MAKYTNIKKIGKGGFGTVWSCKCDSDGKKYAKKNLETGAGESEIRRFRREVRILSNLDHPNIIKVVGKRLINKPYFYVMPLYSGSIYEEMPNIVGNQDRIRPIYSSVLDALEYAHNQGVIHRDLKPQNILLNCDEDVVVSDFGLGREFDAESTRQTLTGYGLGTPLYMAPEQINHAKNADERSDIFSLGRILHELYTGKIIVSSFDTSGLLPEIAVLVRRCTNQDPTKRFQSVTELKTAWNSIFKESTSEKSRKSIDKLIKKLSTDTEANSKDAEKLLTGLLHNLNDEDFIEEVLLSISPGVFGLIEKLDIDGLRQIINAFVKHMTSQGWPFSFTDKIGNCCKEIYHSVDDPEVRAKLIYCTAEVGVSHNRWHVMRIAGNLLSSIKGTGEAIATSELLQGEDYIVGRITEYVDLYKLHSLLIPLFRSDE